MDPSTHSMGSTIITLNPGITVMLNAGNRQNGGFFKIYSGGGTLAIMDNVNQVLAVGAGYPVGATEIISFEGPARFYLAAAGATMQIALVTSYSSYPGFTGLTA